MKVNVGQGLALTTAELEDVIAIVGRRGRGKTNTAVVLVEELQRVGARFCVADPVGVWWGLRSSKDGKAAGIPVVVMGGERGDVPLEETAGKVIADFVADPSSPSVVLDFRGFRKGQMARFMTDFLEQLYHRNRELLHLVLDEADQFAPQRVMGETARLVGAAEDVCKMGRARGLLPILVTQRPAALNKNVLTQAGMLVAHQLTGPQDQKAVDEWIRANAEEGQREAFLGTIAGLDRGEAWFWRPPSIFQRVRVRERRTFDSSATPERGKKLSQPKAAAAVDLEALKQRIASTIERAKAEDPRELRKQIADLKAQLAKASKAAPPAPTTPKRVEVPVLKDSQVKRLEAALDRLEGKGAALHAALGKSIDDLAQRQQVVLAEVAILRNQIRAAVGARAAQPQSAGVTAARGGDSLAVGRPPRSSRPAAFVPSGDGNLPVGERTVLTAIAQHPEGVTREQLSILTGYKRSSRDTYVQRLRSAGLVDFAGDRISATEAGVQTLGPGFEPLPTGDALRAHWLERLPEGERRVFEFVAQAYPRAIDRTSLDEATGYRRSSRDTYLQRLTARRLVRSVGRGEVRAAEELFG